jgi:hypothetical protein
MGRTLRSLQFHRFHRWNYETPCVTSVNFIAEDAIRIAGTRVGIEIIIEDYREGASQEEINLHYPTLSLEQIFEREGEHY